MDTGWFKVSFFLPYLQAERDGELIFYWGEGLMPNDLEVRQQMVLEGAIKEKELYFVKIRSCLSCEAPKQKFD